MDELYGDLQQRRDPQRRCLRNTYQEGPGFRFLATREQLFDDLGTARPSLARERGPRYERSSPNSLWHIDIKGPFFIQLGRGRYLKTYLVGLVDDHSRYVLGLRIQTSQAAARS